MRQKKIIVLGFMASMPISGVIWQHIHYIVGLQRLGHQVYYVEDTYSLPYNPTSLVASNDSTYALAILSSLSRKYGFENRWIYCARYKDPMEITGTTMEGLKDLFRHADCALNICGSHAFTDELALAGNLIYIESDPGVEQIKIDNGDEETKNFIMQHHHRFTFGEAVPTSDFMVPTHGIDWRPTRQPVVTDLWCSSHAAPDPDSSALFTSICNWSTSGTKDISWAGSTYLWSKSLEFLRFVQAPAMVGTPFQLATTITDLPELALFEANMWILTRPNQLSVNSEQYRAYIRESRGEFTCAKDQYVRLHTGWFSDRSACYLASGRPVITQETGFSAYYGGDGGLFGFTTVDQIVDAVDLIRSDYSFHSRAALSIAREFFEAEVVLSALLDLAGVT